MRFIVVDGMDGAGKDTHARLIRRHYEAKGESVLVRSHPTGDNVYGRRAKRALLGRGKLNMFVGPYLRETLQLDKVNTTEEAMIEIYRRLRPGDPPTIRSATALFDSLFFNEE
ncbi:MAG: hypothetical protein R6U10_05640, partial [Thermoplasmatota archaeon]